MKFPNVCVALVAAALAIGAAFSAQAQEGEKTVTVAVIQDAGNWDPIDIFLSYWSPVAANIYDGLVERTSDLKIVPGLAESWEELDGGKRIRFHLRSNVTFQDGEPFNAEAVKFTFDRLLGEEGAKGAQRSNYSAISEVKIIDDKTVDMIMGVPDPVIITKLAGYGAYIVPPKYTTEKGDGFNSAPIGTGPFKVVDYQPKVSMTLEANKNYWRGAPEIDKLVFRFISDSSTQVAELQAGRIDIVTQLPVSLTETVAKDPKLRVESVTGPTVGALRFNTKSGPTANENVRKALVMAVDRDAIANTILLGHAKPTASFQSSVSFGFDPDLKPYPYDPEAAMKLLREAGVAGTTVQIDFRSSDANFREVAQAVAGYLQVVGVNAVVKPYENSVFLADIIPNGKTGEMFQQTWAGWTFDFDNTAYLLYHSGERYNPYEKIPELDALLEKQRAITDRDERLRLLKEVGKLVHDRVLEMPLFNLDTIYGVSSRVKNFSPPADLRMSLAGASVE